MRIPESASVLPQAFKATVSITLRVQEAAIIENQKMENNPLIIQEVDANDSPRRRCVMDLLLAIETQPPGQIKEMIKARLRSIKLFNVGYKVLLKAIEVNNMDVVNFLLDQGCKVNLEKKLNRPNTTPFHLAVKNGDCSLVDRLLSKNASIAAIDERGNSPLHLAFLLKREKIIDRILLWMQKTSKYINMTNSRGLTHMHIACARKNFVVMKRFLDQSMLTVSPVTSKKRIHRKVIVKEEC